MLRFSVYGLVWLTLGAWQLTAVGCLGPASPSGGGGSGETLSGRFTVDGSSTVFPISMAVTEEFSKLHPQVRISVVSTGSGTGIKRLTEGSIEIADSSRAMKPEELQAAESNGITPLELKVGFDGITVAVHRDNNWIESITLEQLKRIWEPGSSIKKWSDLDPSYPAVDITLCGPGEESGTFDFFTEEVIGEAKKCRRDYTPSGDDNVLVNIVSEDKYALGYFGFAHYSENQGRMKALKIGTGAEAQAPTPETISRLTYPLARPLFIYPNARLLNRPEIASFLEFYVSETGQALVREVDYFPLGAEDLARTRATLSAALAAVRGTPTP